MRDDFGDKITPYVLSFWEAVRNYPGIETTGMTPADASLAMSDMLLAGMAFGYPRQREYNGAGRQRR